MSLIDGIKNLLGKAQADAGSKIYIVDAGSIGDSSQKQMSPHQQIQILKKLSSFAKKENINIQALLDGKPLRVVGDGGDFSGVTVYFTRKKVDVDSLIRKRLKAARGCEVTVITPNQELSQEVESAGGQIMSTSTFKKALDAAGTALLRGQRRGGTGAFYEVIPSKSSGGAETEGGGGGRSWRGAQAP